MKPNLLVFSPFFILSCMYTNVNNELSQNATTDRVAILRFKLEVLTIQLIRLPKSESVTAQQQPSIILLPFHTSYVPSNTQFCIPTRL